MNPLASANPLGERALPAEIHRSGLDPEVVGEQLSARRFVQELRIPAHLGCWPGHFRDQPIVPGVLQIDWVMRLVARWTGASPHLTRLEALKFKKAMLPGQRFTLELERDAESKRFQFRLADGATLFSLGRLVIGDPRGC